MKTYWNKGKSVVRAFVMSQFVKSPQVILLQGRQVFTCMIKPNCTGDLAMQLNLLEIIGKLQMMCYCLTPGKPCSSYI